MPRRIVTITLLAVALILCMTAGWHTWPPAIGIGIVLGFWVAGYKVTEDQLRLSDRDLQALLHG